MIGYAMKDFGVLDVLRKQGEIAASRPLLRMTC